MKTFEEFVNENILQKGFDFVKSKMGLQTSQQKKQQNYDNKTNPVMQSKAHLQAANNAFSELGDVILNTARIMQNAGNQQAWNWHKNTEQKLAQIRQEINQNLGSVK